MHAKNKYFGQERILIVNWCLKRKHSKIRLYNLRTSRLRLKYLEKKKKISNGLLYILTLFSIKKVQRCCIAIMPLSLTELFATGSMVTGQI